MGVQPRALADAGTADLGEKSLFLFVVLFLTKCIIKNIF